MALPFLDRLLSRSTFTPGSFRDADALRFALFGVGHSEPLPVAALTCLVDRKEKPAYQPAGKGAGKPDAKTGSDYYYLRADPVTLWADMARVIMTSYGFADLDDMERNEIENVIRKVFHEEGMQLGSEHPERWTIALERSLDFRFSPLKQALGMDAADLLPDQPEALYWRRILNEIQVALHSCPVNVRRRQQGRVEINSVWFWGQGFMPPVSGRTPFREVYSNHPVSLGLGLIHDCVVRDLATFDPMSRRNPVRDNEAPQVTAVPAGSDKGVLVDWTVPAGPVKPGLASLEETAGQLLSAVRKHGLIVDVYAGDGSCWTLDRWRLRRFWRRGSARGQAARIPREA